MKITILSPLFFVLFVPSWFNVSSPIEVMPVIEAGEDRMAREAVRTGHQQGADGAVLRAEPEGVAQFEPDRLADHPLQRQAMRDDEDVRLRRVPVGRHDLTDGSGGPRQRL